MTESPRAITLSSSIRPRSLSAWLLVGVMAAIGIGETVPAIRYALRDHSSDVLRQWRTSQYVLARVNPYPVALAALEAAYGSSAPEHLRTLKIYAIPKQGPHPDTRKDIGPPEATYPPTSALILAFAIGHLHPDALLLIWTLLNLALFVLVGKELIRLECVQNAKLWSLLFLLSLGLLWPATANFFSRGQFSLIVLWSVLVAERMDDRRSWLSGVLYSLALMKPSLGLPFLFVPLIRRRWMSLVYTAAIQVALFMAAGWLLRSSPITLTSEWLSVCRYFMKGMYTMQEIINNLHLAGTVWDIVIPFAIVLGAGWLIRRFEPNRRLAMLCLLAVTWTYHYPYDFVVFLGVIAFLLTPFDRPQQWDVWQWCGFIALLVLGVALSDSAAGGQAVAWRIARWGGRIALLWLILSIARAKHTNAVGRETMPSDALNSARVAPGF